MEEVITCPRCGNCYKKIHEKYHFFNLCKKDNDINKEDLQLATQLINNDLNKNIPNYSNDDISSFNLLPTKNNNNNIIRKSKSDVSHKVSLIENNDSKFFLLDNQIILDDTSTIIIPEERLSIFGNYLNELKESINNALDPNLIKYLPEFTINDNSYNGKMKECTICLNEIKMNERVILLPCLHIFHSDCIKKNFERKNTCPNCNLILNYENMKGSILNSVIKKNNNNNNNLYKIN